MNLNEIEKNLGDQNIKALQEMGFSFDNIIQAFQISQIQKKNVLEVLLDYL